MGNFELRYIRNKEKQEIDFLILRDKKVFLAVEAKHTDEQLSPSWHKFMFYLNCPYGIQVVRSPNVYKIHQFMHYKILVISAGDFLRYLI